MTEKKIQFNWILPMKTGIKAQEMRKCSIRSNILSDWSINMSMYSHPRIERIWDFQRSAHFSELLK
jgi:hypothetical protein